MVPIANRPPKSAAEIGALPPLGTTECLSHIRERGASFSPETLIYLFRWATDNHDSILAEVAGRFLIGWQDLDGRWHGGHCEGTIVKLAKRFGFRRDTEE